MTCHGKAQTKSLIRKSWPRVRFIKVKGEKFYQVDARRQGTNGKRETFSIEKESVERAAKIEKEFAENGAEGLSLSAELRAMSVHGRDILEPLGKTISDAVAFYKQHLDQEKKNADTDRTTTRRCSARCGGGSIPVRRDRTHFWPTAFNSNRSSAAATFARLKRTVRCPSRNTGIFRFRTSSSTILVEGRLSAARSSSLVIRCRSIMAGRSSGQTRDRSSTGRAGFGCHSTTQAGQRLASRTWKGPLVERAADGFAHEALG